MFIYLSSSHIHIEALINQTAVKISNHLFTVSSWVEPNRYITTIKINAASDNHEIHLITILFMIDLPVYPVGKISDILH